MVENKQVFKVLEFKTQDEINADRRKEFEMKRDALRRRAANIRNQGSHRPGSRKSYV